MDKVAQAVGVALRLAPRSPGRAASGFVPGAAPLPGSDDNEAARRRCAVTINPLSMLQPPFWEPTFKGCFEAVQEKILTLNEDSFQAFEADSTPGTDPHCV